MIYPDATWWPGAAAGYRWGRTPLLSTVCHFTVGRDSAGIGLRGIFNFLVRRDGEVVQFAEADARCGHAGDPYNSRGPGIEVEYLPGVDDTMFTDVQLAATGGLVRWLSQWMPLDYYDNPAVRLPDWAGFISHRSIVSNADLHSDYWDRADWDRMVTPTEETFRMKPGLFLDAATGRVYVYDPNNHTKTWLMTPDALASWQAIAALNGISTDIVDNATSRTLLADAVDLRVQSTSGGAAVPLTVTLTGTATP